MREIKFRAWEPNYGGRMHYSDQEHAGYKDETGKCSWHIRPEGIHIELWNYSYGPNNPEMHKVTPEDQVIMQYTGLKDRNGTPIYEGDVIKYSGELFEVIYYERWASFGFRYADSLEYYLTQSIENPLEVMGNIYQNPNLLE